jgi:hypothetical protein
MIAKEGLLAHNVRHELDQDLVKQSVDKAILKIGKSRMRLEEARNDYERDVAAGNSDHWHGAPMETDTIARRTDERIAFEMNHYARVRVIELPTRNEKRFILVYGDTDDSTVERGTGPFVSVEEAAGWFYRTGR